MRPVLHAIGRLWLRARWQARLRAASRAWSGARQAGRATARTLLLALAACLVALPAIMRPGDLPEPAKPWSPVDLDAHPGLMQRWKIRALAWDRTLCLQAITASRARAEIRADRIRSPQCHIRPRVRLSGLSTARLPPVDTTCAIAARLYLWEREVVQPAARRLLGQQVVRISHFSSFSCRRIRTARGPSSRWSQHATANAFDIAGFVLADGRAITLLKHWDGTGPEARFLRTVRDGLCDWFNLVLSPDYNALHADHFHVDMGPFPGCR